LLYLTNNRSKHITQVNLAICFPEKTPAEQKLLLKRSLIDDACKLVEALWLWKNADEVMTSMIGTIHNKHLLEQAKNPEQSTIFVTPHYGSWELAGLYTASVCGLNIMYTPAKIPYIEELSRQGRMKTGATLQQSNAKSLRTFITLLKQGGNIGILPDQVPAHNAGVFAPFFKRACFTSTIITKLANRHDCKVILAYAVRSKQKPVCYDIHYSIAPKKVYDPDPVQAACGLNEYIEELVRISAEDYLWGYKRFKRAAPGDQSPY
jgi:KDO2-lipid IV(A) lauroyltransferase